MPNFAQNTIGRQAGRKMTPLPVESKMVHINSSEKPREVLEIEPATRTVQPMAPVARLFPIFFQPEHVGFDFW